MNNGLNNIITKIKAMINYLTHGTLMSNENYLRPILQRHWATHCAYPNVVVLTMFSTHQNQGGIQVVSNSNNHLLLNIALDQPNDYIRLIKFKRHRFYPIFTDNNNIFDLEFGDLTETAVQITSEILTDVFDIAVDKQIETIFEMYK